MLTLQELNHDCLLKIFEFLPVDDLLKLHFIIPKWRDFQKKICGKRTILKIVQMNSDPKHHLWADRYREKYPNFMNDDKNTVFLQNVDSYSIQFLLENFPKVDSLILILSNLSEENFLLLLESTKNRLKFLILSTNSIFLFKNNSFPSLSRLEHILIQSPEYAFDKLLKETREMGLKSFVYNSENAVFDKEILFKKLSSNICSLSLNLEHFLMLSNRRRDIQSIENPVILDYRKRERQLFSSFLQVIPREGLSSLSFEKGQDKNLIIDERILRLPLKSLSINIELFKVDDYVLQSDCLTTLKLLDGDFEPSTFGNLLWAFPNIRDLSLNCSHICCECREPEVPPIPLSTSLSSNDASGQQPAQNAPPAQSGDNNPPLQPLPFPEMPNLEIPLPVPEPNNNEPEEIIYVTCDVCSKKIIDSIANLPFLSRFQSIGTSCNSEIINGLCNCPNIRVIDFTYVESPGYSLKCLLETAFRYGKENSNTVLTVFISNDMKRKIVRLPKNVPNVNLVFR